MVQSIIQYMKLDREHRAALLEMLEATTHEIDTLPLPVATASLDVISYNEMRRYLLKEKKATIIKALTDNEIDY